MLQNEVYIRKEDHKYFNRTTGEQLISWSRFVDYFFPKFDPNIAKHCAGKGKYAGMTEQDVLSAWDVNRVKASDHGTTIHDALEHFHKYFQHQPGTEELVPLVEAIHAEYKDYYRSYSEEILYTKAGIAGTCDKLFLVNKKTFDLKDYKTNLSKGIEFFPGVKVKDQWALGPISHLTNCNYTKYVLQLSMYAYMMEELYGMKCRNLTIIYIPPEDKLQYVKLPLPYLKSDVKNMIDWYENKILLGEIKHLPNLNECLLFQ